MLQLTCKCGRKLQVDESYAGRRGRCKSCGRTLEIPKTTDTASRPVERERTQNSTGVRPVESLRAGEYVGQFLIERKLGEGAMGEVWLAKDELLDRDVAIKVLPDDLRNDQDRLQRFEREAKLMAKLHHPHAVTVHYFGTDKNLLYIVMEFVSGGSLEDRVQATGALPWRDATLAIRDAASGLAEAHRLGLIHRDIKPANLLQTNEGVTKVGDFGLARPVLQKTQMTQHGGILGTPSYMAPEQWDGKPADARSDIYALICTYHFLLTGRPPFEADNFLAMGQLHRSQPFPDPRKYNPDVPQSAKEIVDYGSQKDPGARYQTADELVSKLNMILDPPAQDRSGLLGSKNHLGISHWLTQIPRLTHVIVGTSSLLMILGIVYFIGNRVKPSAFVSPIPPGGQLSASTVLNPDREWLQNPGCEDSLIEDRIPEWSVVKGDWKPRSNLTHSGRAAFYAGESAMSELFQDIDVQPISSLVDLDSVNFQFSCFIHTLKQNPPDTCRIIVEMRDQAKQILSSHDTDEQSNVSDWSLLNLCGEVPRETRWIRVRMQSRRYGSGTRNCDAYYDDLSLRVIHRDRGDADSRKADRENDQTNPSLDDTEVFLSGFLITSSKTHQGRFSLNGQILVDPGLGEKTFRLDGKTMSHSIFIHPPPTGLSYVTFQLDKGWNEFRCAVLVPRLGDEKKGIGSPVFFKLYGDAKLIWTSRPVQNFDELQEVSIDISGVTSLKLETSCGESSSNARAVWMEPILIRKTDLQGSTK